MRNKAVLILLIGFWALTPDYAPAQMSQNPGVFTGRDAAALIADALIKQNAGNDVKVTVNEAREDDIIAQSGNAIVADADNVSFDKARNRWEAILLLKEDGHNLAPIHLTGRYDELTQVPVLKRPMQQGEVIGEADIDWSKEPLDHVRKNTVTDIHDLIGKSPKHMVSQGRAVRLDEIANPPIVAKGVKVTLVYRTSNIEIMTFGETLDAGAKGDVIRVRNITSKAIIQGIVESPDHVRVSAPESSSAEAM